MKFLSAFRQIRLKTLSEHFNGSFFCVLLLTALCFLPYTKILLASDAKSRLNNFNFFYNEFVTNGQVPLWSPHMLYGMHSDLDTLTALTPFCYFAALLGKLLNCKNAFSVFRFAMFLELLTFSVGMYLLAVRLYKKRMPALWVTAGCTLVFFSVWQPQFNLLLFYMTPLVLLGIHEYYRSRDIRWLLSSGLFFAISLIGNLPYAGPILMLAYATFFVAYGCCLGSFRLAFLLRPRNCLRFSTLALLLLTALFSAAYLDAILHSTDWLVTCQSGRMPDSKVELWTFLTRGTSNSPAYLLQLLYAFPKNVNYTFYIGLIPLVYLVYAACQLRDPASMKAMLWTFAVLVCLSLGSLTILAPLLYQCVPGMKYYRFVEEGALPLARLFLLMAAGFGFCHSLDNDNQPNWNNTRRALSNICFGLVGVVLLLDIFVFKGKCPYADLKEGAYSIHLVALSLVSILGLYLRNGATWHAAPKAILALYILEMASFNFSVHWLLDVPGIRKPLITFDQPVSAKRLSELYAHMNDVFIPRKHPFEQVRSAKLETFLERTPEVRHQLWHDIYVNFFQSFYLDCAIQDRVATVLPRGIDMLVKSKLGEAPDDTILVPDANDVFRISFILSRLFENAALMAAVGCETQKFYVAACTPVRTLEEARQAVASNQNLHDQPVVLAPNQQPEQLMGGNGYWLSSITDFTANTLLADVEVHTESGSGSGAWLVYLDGYHPGWTCTVNGTNTEIAQANMAFKAIKVNEGINKVRFEFKGNTSRSIPFRWLCFTLGVVLVTLLSAVAIATLLHLYPDSTSTPSTVERQAGQEQALSPQAG